MRRLVEVSAAASRDLEALPAHIKKALTEAIELLAHEAEVRTTHRHPMEGRFSPHWETRVGDHRIYYLFDAQTVTVVAIREKGRKPLKQIWRPSRPRAA